jgi:hypothetical protein
MRAMNLLQPISEDEDDFDKTVPPIEGQDVPSPSPPIFLGDNLSRLSIDSGHSQHSRFEGIDDAVVRAYIITLQIPIRVY